MNINSAHILLFFSLLILLSALFSILYYWDKKKYLIGRFKKNSKKLASHQMSLKKIVAKRNLHSRLTIDRKRSYEIYLDQLYSQSKLMEMHFSDLQQESSKLENAGKYMRLLDLQNEEIGLLKAELYILKREKKMSA